MLSAPQQLRFSSGICRPARSSGFPMRLTLVIQQRVARRVSNLFQLPYFWLQPIYRRKVTSGGGVLLLIDEPDMLVRALAIRTPEALTNVTL
jgi:hypothetical protein